MSDPVVDSLNRKAHEHGLIFRRQRHGLLSSSSIRVAVYRIDANGNHLAGPLATLNSVKEAEEWLAQHAAP